LWSSDKQEKHQELQQQQQQQQKQQKQETEVISADTNQNIDDSDEVEGYTPLRDTFIQPDYTSLEAIGDQTAEPAVEIQQQKQQQQQQPHEPEVSSADNSENIDDGNDVQWYTALFDTVMEPDYTTLNTTGAETAEELPDELYANATTDDAEQNTEDSPPVYENFALSDTEQQNTEYLILCDEPSEDLYINDSVV